MGFVPWFYRSRETRNGPVPRSGTRPFSRSCAVVSPVHVRSDAARPRIFVRPIFRQARSDRPHCSCSPAIAARCGSAAIRPERSDAAYGPRKLGASRRACSAAQRGARCRYGGCGRPWLAASVKPSGIPYSGPRESTQRPGPPKKLAVMTGPPQHAGVIGRPHVRWSSGGSSCRTLPAPPRAIRCIENAVQALVRRAAAGIAICVPAIVSAL